MESFDNENDDKRTQQVLSSDVQARVVEAFEVFDHENNKTVDVREVGTIVRSLGHCPMESQLQEVGMGLMVLGSVVLCQQLKKMGGGIH